MVYHCVITVLKGVFLFCIHLKIQYKTIGVNCVFILYSLVFYLRFTSILQMHFNEEFGDHTAHVF